MENELEAAEREHAQIAEELTQLQKRKSAVEEAIDRGEPDPVWGSNDPSVHQVSLSEVDRYITDASRRLRLSEQKVRELRRRK